MEISQYTWSRQTVVLSGRDGSVWRLSLTVHLDGVFMSIHIRPDESHCKPLLCQICLKVTRPVLQISRSFEGHCALTNADEANEVQQNVVTVKKER